MIKLKLTAILIAISVVLSLLSGCSETQDIGAANSEDYVWSTATDAESRELTKYSSTQAVGYISEFMNMADKYAKLNVGAGITDSHVVEVKEILANCDNLDTSTEHGEYLAAVSDIFREIYNFYLQNGTTAKFNQTLDHAEKVYKSLSGSIKELLGPIDRDALTTTSVNFRIFGFKKSEAK